MHLCLTLYKSIKESIVAKATKQADKSSAKASTEVVAAPSKAELIRAAKAGASAAVDVVHEEYVDDQSSVASSQVSKRLTKRDLMKQEMRRLQDNIILGTEFAATHCIF